MDRSVSHAEIGTLEAMDFDNERIVTAAATDDATVFRSYMTRATTAVDGLGGITSVGEIPNDVYGSIVVVEFTMGEERPVAQRLLFPATTRVSVTRGVISRVDLEAQELTLVHAPDPDEMNLGIGYGATIDSPAGLMELEDLERGDEVTVYYDETASDTGIAFLLYNTG